MAFFKIQRLTETLAPQWLAYAPVPVIGEDVNKESVAEHNSGLELERYERVQAGRSRAATKRQQELRKQQEQKKPAVTENNPDTEDQACCVV